MNSWQTKLQSQALWGCSNHSGDNDAQSDRQTCNMQDKPRMSKEFNEANAGKPDKTKQNQKSNNNKTVDKSSKSDSRIQQNQSSNQVKQQPNSTKSKSKSGKEVNSQIEQKGGCQPNVDWWVMMKGGSQKSTTIPKHRLNRLDEVSVTVNLTTF